MSSKYFIKQTIGKKVFWKCRELNSNGPTGENERKSKKFLSTCLLGYGEIGKKFFG